MTYIKGKFRNAIYQNDNGFFVGIFRIKETDDEILSDLINKTITVTGSIIDINLEDTYTLYGEYTTHERFGNQYKFKNYEKVIPTTEESIVEFLSSSLIKGCGSKTAKKIVDVFKEDTINKIKESYTNLLLVPNITEKKACPIGFAVDYILTEDEFMMISQEQKALVLMQAAIIDESELNKLENVASSIRKSDFDYEENIDSLVDKTISNKVLEFHKDSHGFTCTTFYDKNRLIYFTVPWSEGWKVSIDGKETKLINSGGMMALIVPEGKHQVEFVYHTPGFFIGIITSLVSCFIFIIYVMYNIKTVRAEKSA